MLQVRALAANDRWRTFVLATLITGFFFGGAVHAAWIRAETSHFVVYSSVEQSTTREYLEQLEAFKYLAEMILGADPESLASTAKFTIYLLDSQDLLKVVRPNVHRWVGGFYLHCSEGALAFAYRPLAFALDRPDYGLIILLHEYAHHLMYSRMRRFYPTWYVEGFADYMSTVRLHRGAYIVGDNHQDRSQRLSGERRWIDMRTMLDPVAFMAAAKKGEINSLQFYAQAWLLTHYMLSDSQRAQSFNEYFRRLGEGEDAIVAFETATGTTVAELGRYMRAHLRKLPGLRVTVPNLPETAITITRLAKQQDEYLLQAAALRSCPEREHGRQVAEHLRRLRREHSSDTQLRIEWSRAELLFGDAAPAHKELEALVQSGHDTFEVSYLLGRSYYEAAQRLQEHRDALINKAAEHFLKAYQANKRDAPTLYYLSRSLDTDATPSKAMVNAAIAASVLAPSVSEYAIHAATVSLRNDDREMAAHVMHPFASDPHNPSYAARVTAMIRAIRDERPLEEVMATLSEPQADAQSGAAPPPAGTPEEPTEQPQEDAEPKASYSGRSHLQRGPTSDDMRQSLK